MEIMPQEANPVSKRVHPASANYRLSSKPDAAQEIKCPNCTDISKAGKFRNIVSGMRGEGKNGVHSFHQELRQKIQSGNFNAAEMADNAPDRLKAWAGKTGVALEDLMNQWQDKATAINKKYSEISFSGVAMGRYHRCCHGHGPNTAENPNSVLASMTAEDRAEMYAFRQEVCQAIQDGTLDAEELAGKAPAELTVWAQEHGIDLVEKLNQLAERAAEINEKLAPPSENKDEESPADSLLEHILIDYLTMELENTIIDLSDDDKSAIQSLDQEIRQGIQDGTFNTADLIEKIPVGLRSWAEENGIELQEALNQWAGIGAVPEETPATDTVS